MIKEKKQPAAQGLEMESPHGLGEWLKKAMISGAGAVFMTEESIRSALLEMNLPKNAISSILSQAEKTKEDLKGMIAKEVCQFLAGIELDKLLKKALADQEVEINVRIRFKGEGTKKRPQRPLK